MKVPLADIAALLGHIHIDLRWYRATTNDAHLLLLRRYSSPGTPGNILSTAAAARVASATGSTVATAVNSTDAATLIATAAALDGSP